MGNDLWKLKGTLEGSRLFTCTDCGQKAWGTPLTINFIGTSKSDLTDIIKQQITSKVDFPVGWSSSVRDLPNYVFLCPKCL